MQNNDKKKPVVCVTRKAYEILQDMCKRRNALGESCTLTSINSEIIVKAGKDAENQLLLG